MADKYVINTSLPEISDKTNAKLFGGTSTGLPGYVKYPTSATLMHGSRTIESKLKDIVSIKDFGAKGDGVTDDTPFFIEASEAGDHIHVPNGNWNVSFTALNTSSIKNLLRNMSLYSDLALNFGPSVYNFDDNIVIDIKNGSRLTLNGANPTTFTILQGTPSVVATNISGNRNSYAVTIPLSSAVGLSIGDWVVVKTTGLDLSFTSYDETVSGARHKELDGFFEVLAVNTTGTHTVTVKNLSQQDSSHFPGAGTIPATSANFTGGTVKKIHTIFKFTGEFGTTILSDIGMIKNIGIIGDKSGSYVSGVSISSENKPVSIGVYNVGISGFSGSGFNADGSRVSVEGNYMYSSGNGTHGFRIKRGRASIPNSTACGNGAVVGNGFFATHGAFIDCDGSTAHGNRNTGFIANRVSNMCAESCFSINNGNYADEVSGGWVEREGKGFESEAGSNIYCQGSVAIFNTENGFYALAGARMDARECVGSGQLHGNGFYSIISSSISSRYSVAKRNAGSGFYANAKSFIMADGTVSGNNTVLDYQASGSSDVSIAEILNSTATRQISTEINRLTMIPGETLVISSGSITLSSSFHTVDTEGSSAADDLVTINGGSEGVIAILRTLNSSRDVVVKHGTGNIFLGGAADRTLSDIKDRIVLMYRSATASWHELSFGDNA